MIQELVDKNDSILKREMKPFDFSNPPVDPVVLYNDLAETMIENGGIGLSANQVGLPYRFFVMRSEEIIGCFNPKIVDFSSEQVILEEGCLSYPNLYVKIKRPKIIKVRYTLPNGETVTRKFDGITARCFQHELDHLNGIVYTKRANKIHLEQANKIVKKMSKYPVRKINEMSEQARNMIEWLKS
jgi:peptide deformylase